MSKDSTPGGTPATGGNTAAFPFRYVEATPDKLLGPLGLEQFNFQLGDLYAQLDSDHAVRKNGWAKGKLVVTFDIELDEQGHCRATHAVKSTGPRMKAGTTAMKAVNGVILAEEENPDLHQGRLPGFTPAELEAEEEARRLRKALVAMGADELEAILARKRKAEQEPTLPAREEKPEPTLPAREEKPEPTLPVAAESDDGPSDGDGDTDTGDGNVVKFQQAAE